VGGSLSGDPLDSLPNRQWGEFSLSLLPFSLCPLAFYFYQQALFTIRVQCTLSAVSQE